MKAFVFMNHRIRDKKTKGPVIAVQAAGGALVEANTVVINGPSIIRFDPRGCPFVHTHEVRAWVECDWQDLVVR